MGAACGSKNAIQLSKRVFLDVCCNFPWAPLASVWELRDTIHNLLFSYVLVPNPYSLGYSSTADILDMMTAVTEVLTGGANAGESGTGTLEEDMVIIVLATCM